MTSMRIHLTLRVLTLMGSAAALMGMLWCQQTRADEAMASSVQQLQEVASAIDFDTSRVKLVVFAMSTCGHCKQFKKELATLVAAVPRMQVEMVEYAPGANTASNRAAQQRISLAAVQGFPTTLVMVDGVSAVKMPGYRPAADLARAVSEQVSAYDRALQASM